jgi:NAD(P)H-flavin reductase
VHVVFGARSGAELYDLAAIEKLAARWPWLTVTPVVSHDPRFPGEQGTVADAVVRRFVATPQHAARYDAYVCGSTAMVEATAGRLQSAGMPREQIFIEDFGNGE